MILQRNHQRVHLVLYWRSTFLVGILNNVLQYLFHQLLDYKNQLDIKQEFHYQQHNIYQLGK